MRPSEKAMKKVIGWLYKGGIVAYPDESNPFHLNAYPTHLGRIVGERMVYVVYTNEGWTKGQPNEFLIDRAHEKEARLIAAINKDETRLALATPWTYTGGELKWINGRAFLNCTDYGVYEL